MENVKCVKCKKGKDVKLYKGFEFECECGLIMICEDVKTDGIVWRIDKIDVLEI